MHQIAMSQALRLNAMVDSETLLFSIYELIQENLSELETNVLQEPPPYLNDNQATRGASEGGEDMHRITGANGGHAVIWSHHIFSTESMHVLRLT